MATLLSGCHCRHRSAPRERETVIIITISICAHKSPWNYTQITSAKNNQSNFNLISNFSACICIFLTKRKEKAPFCLCHKNVEKRPKMLNENRIQIEKWMSVVLSVYVISFRRFVFSHDALNTLRKSTNNVYRLHRTVSSVSRVSILLWGFFFIFSHWTSGRMSPLSQSDLH